ncbi:MAG: hypothetical protein Q8R18_05430 [bacterium]|nr:hypothetical protein [bacterium]
MDKKGEEHQFFFAMEAILGILVAGILILTAANFDSISNINKIYAQEDLKLLIETIQASPGAIEYNYKLKEMYEVQIQEEDIKVTTNNNLFNGYSYYNLTLRKEQGENTIQVKKNA